jgi:hypothetical protein
MAARLFSDLVNRIAPSTPGAPQPVIITHVRNAAIEACERTLAYKYVQAEQTLVNGTYSYAYAPAATTEVHAILAANINDTIKITPKTVEQVTRIYPFWPTTAAALRGSPLYVVHFDADTYLMARTPDGVTTYLLHMVLALKPLRTATGLEQSVFDELEDVIVHGTLQHMLVLPEQTWSDNELAAYHAKQFVFKIAERRARATVGAGRAVLTARAQSWA